MPGLTGGDNVWVYTAVIAMNDAAFEVCLGREWNKHEEVKLKCFITYHFAELPSNYLKIFSIFGKFRDQQHIKWHSVEKMDGNCTKLGVWRE